MNETQALQFAQQFAAGQPVTAEAQAAFRDWLLNHSDTEITQLLETYLQVVQAQGVLAPVNPQWSVNLLQKIEAEETTKAVPLQPRRRFWWRYAAAAVLFAGMATSAYLFYQRQSPSGKPGITASRYKNDVAPGSAKASLTLADGSVVVLDEQQNGRLAQQGSVSVIKSDSGQLVYRVLPADIAATGKQSLAGRTGHPEYNTLHTPRGGQYQVLLPDGSKVWLNAASSLRFPTAFTGNERSVELTGEAYFEVAKGMGDKAQPFIVQVHNFKVAVLGTHFNINAYDNETIHKVTLLEGKVRVDKGGNSYIITPGQEATIAATGVMVAAADTDEAVAWKNGLFQFTNTGLEQVLHQVERWYNVNVDYKGIPDKHFYGIISRNSNLSQVLSMLEVTGGVKFYLEGNALQVLR